MQIDMHFYGAYAVARIAGFSPEEAKTIATAAQFVDEAVAAEPVEVNGQSYMLPVVSAHKMLDLDNGDPMDQWRVWLPFHFLPGNRGNDVSQRLLCLWGESDNAAAESVIRLALREKGRQYGLHLLGIVTHVIQDTYAHYGFCGISSDRNNIDQSTLDSDRDGLSEFFGAIKDKVFGTLAENSRLGHASVVECPDTPYLEWKFKYEDLPEIPVQYSLEDRDNKDSFYLACTRLLAIYQAFRADQVFITAPGGHGAFDINVEAEIRTILAYESESAEDRSELWRERMEANTLFPVIAEERDLRFDDAGWSYEFMRGAGAAATMTDAFLFNRAAARYLDHIHDVVLPELGILSN